MRFLKVGWSASGRRTLMEREGERGLFADPQPPSSLFANVDQADFYRAVARRMGELASKGVEFRYEDSDAEEVGRDSN